MTRPKLLTAYGQKRLRQARAKALAGVPYALVVLLASILLAGCTTTNGDFNCRWEGTQYVCGGNVVGM